MWNRHAQVVMSIVSFTVAGCDSPAAPVPLVAVEAELVVGEPGAVAITALNVSDGVVWFTCTQPRFVVERRVAGEWVEYQSAGGVLCDEAGPFPLSPGEDLLQFAHLEETGTYRFGVWVQDEPDMDAAGEVEHSDPLVFAGNMAQAD